LDERFLPQLPRETNVVDTDADGGKSICCSPGSGFGDVLSKQGDLVVYSRSSRVTYNCLVDGGVRDGNVVG
jgi:hypothetical protein